jgi:hypothetical protein
MAAGAIPARPGIAGLMTRFVWACRFIAANSSSGTGWRKVLRGRKYSRARLPPGASAIIAVGGSRNSKAGWLARPESGTILLLAGCCGIFPPSKVQRAMWAA